MTTVTTTVRIPPELHALIKTSAENERRSLNSQIIVLLEAGLVAGQKKVVYR